MMHINWFFETIIDLTFAGFVGAIILLVMSAVKLKNTSVACAKRLYLPPTNSVKNLIGTGKGIAVREAARATRVQKTVKEASGTVGASAKGIKLTLQRVPWNDTKVIIENVRNVINVISLASKFVKTATDRNEAHSSPAGTSGTI